MPATGRSATKALRLRADVPEGSMGWLADRGSAGNQLIGGVAFDPLALTPILPDLRLWNKIAQLDVRDPRQPPFRTNIPKLKHDCGTRNAFAGDGLVKLDQKTPLRPCTSSARNWSGSGMRDQGIMARDLKRRSKRPDTWVHRPAMQKVQ